jgi:hypothetical protein
VKREEPPVSVGLSIEPRTRVFQEFTREIIEIYDTTAHDWDIRLAKWRREVEGAVRLEPRDRALLRELSKRLID